MGNLEGRVTFHHRHGSRLGPHSIRVNTIHPTGVATGMVMNESMAKLFEANDVTVSAMQNVLPIQILQPEDIAEAVAWLVCDEPNSSPAPRGPSTPAHRCDKRRTKNPMTTSTLDTTRPDISLRIGGESISIG